MSQSSILPGGVPGGGVPSPYGDDEDEGGGRQRLLLLGGGAGVVVLLLAAYLLLHGGGSSSPDSTGVVARGTPNAAISPSAGTSGGTGAPKAHQSPGTKLPPKSHTRIARDPFKALFDTAPPGAGGGAGSGTTTTDGGQPVTSTTVGPAVPPAPGSTTGTVVIPTAPSEGGTPSSGTGGVTTHGSPIYVELIKTIGVKEAVFNVGYQNHKFRQFTVTAPAAGSTQGTIFDNEFSLLSIQGNEVTIQVGDDTPFDLRKGVAHQLV